MTKGTRPGRVGRRPWWLLILILAMAAVSACQADFAVEVTVEDDGSGVVEAVLVLDADASAALLDLDRGSAGLPLADLVQSGWDVSPPEVGADGSTTVTASKGFGTTAQFTEVISELTGDDGVFRNFRLFRTKTFARVDYQVTGTIDTSDGLDGFGDADLNRVLGSSLTEIAEGYGANAEDVTISLEIALPGEIQGEGPPEAVGGGEPRAIWPVTLAEPEIVSVELASATREVSALVLRGVAVVAAVLAGLAVFAQVARIILPDRRRRTPRRRTPNTRPPRIPPTDPPVVTTPPEEAEVASVGAASGPRVVAFDGQGVLYRRGEARSKVLIPFARERASTVADDEIEAKVRLLELGRITTGEFWRSIGVAGEASALDAEYFGQLHLTPGVIKYLRALRDRGVRAACITNDAMEWAARVKAGHSLEGLLDPWVVSGAVGVRKPDRPIFEVLRRVTEEEPAAILIIDDDLDILDAARDLGFATAWFSADGSRELARDHSIIRNFDVIAEEPAEPEPAG